MNAAAETFEVAEVATVAGNFVEAVTEAEIVAFVVVVVVVAVVVGTELAVMVLWDVDFVVEVEKTVAASVQVD